MKAGYNIMNVNRLYYDSPLNKVLFHKVKYNNKVTQKGNEKFSISRIL